MQFSNTTTNAGIIQTIEQTTNQPLGTISGSTNSLAYFTNLINSWLHIASSWIQEVHGEWQYDDFNHTDFPIETFACVDNQQDYGLTSTGEKDSLIVRRVEGQFVSSDDWYDLSFCFEKDIVENWDGQTKGIPYSYWLSGSSIFFDVPVDTSQVDYFRITYDRNAHLFTTADTTAEPGFDQKFHTILVYGPSMEWALVHGRNEVVNLCNKMLFGGGGRDKGLKVMLQDFYANRAREAVMPKRINLTWK